MGELLGNFPEFTVQFFRKVVLLVQSEIKNSIKVRTDLAAGIGGSIEGILDIEDIHISQCFENIFRRKVLTIFSFQIIGQYRPI